MTALEIVLALGTDVLELIRNVVDSYKVVAVIEPGSLSVASPVPVDKGLTPLRVLDGTAISPSSDVEYSTAIDVGAGESTEGDEVADVERIVLWEADPVTPSKVEFTPTCIVTRS